MGALLDIRILEEPFDPNAAADWLTDRTPDAGGVATFIGKVRAGDAAADAVKALELSHYEPLTLPGMQALAEEANGRFRLMGLVMLHRVGTLRPGDPIVCVSAASRHRRDAILAVDFCMDHLKSAAWFWKRELRIGDQGGKGDQSGQWHWIEPRDADHIDLTRWD